MSFFIRHLITDCYLFVDVKCCNNILNNMRLHMKIVEKRDIYRLWLHTSAICYIK